MHRAPLIAAFLLLSALFPAYASSQEVPAAPPAPPETAAPAGMELALEGTYRTGRDRIAFVGSRLRLRGLVGQFAEGQVAEITIKRGRKVVKEGRETVASPDGASGEFAIDYRTRKRGMLTVAVKVLGPDGQPGKASAPLRIAVVRPRARRGSRGPFVRFVRARLAAMHYAVSGGSRFSDATARAVLAYRKVNGMSRTRGVNRGIATRLAEGKGAFRPRHGGGKHVEADISRQLLALIGGNGDVERVYHMSSGKSSTPTVLGTFHFYMKQPGTNGKRMVHSSYFIRGYAIHGFNPVPTSPASHGCIRVPIPNALSIFRWIHNGDAIHVYR